ncbi:MAG: DNA polymerase III subunit alpha [Erysipelotrichaceae bacterium]
MQVCFHMRSAYSLLESTLRIKTLVGLAKSGGYDAVALCDLNVLYGVVEFYDACKANDIIPIIGMEFFVTLEDERFSFIAYAKNNQGYQNLIQLSLILQDQATLTWEQVRQYQSNLRFVNAGNASAMETALLEEDKARLEHYILRFQADLDDYCVGLAMNDNALYRLKNRVLVELANKHQLVCIPLPRCYYPSVDELEAYKVLCGISQGRTINDPALLFNSNCYFKPAASLPNFYDQDILTQANTLMQDCSVRLEDLHTSLPVYENKLQIESARYLRELAQAGLKKRLHPKPIPEAYQQRLLYELDIVTSKQFEDYFLIVYDFIRYAKLQGIYVGPGRGSAAGSLISYCLGITGVDPIAYRLVFERFLNPERLSMPDIDIDFPDNRRDEVIAYVRTRYGSEHVANIATFGTLGAKQVIRDVAKVYGVAPREIDTLAKNIPNMLKMTLSRAYQENNRFQSMIDQNSLYQKVYQTALQLEGLPRHISTHAAGVVLAKDKIADIIPVSPLQKGEYLTQFQMDQLERFGLIKIDFLGLRNLTIIDEVCDEIKKSRDFDIMKIDLDDPKTLAMVSQAQTQGVFQLESAGMRSLLKRMQPKSFEEVAAVIALFRPGPMQFIDQYLANREHPESIAYLHEVLRPHLEHTYGIMIYQEQIIAVASEMASFSAGKAELLRKAISKKIGSQFEALSNEFIRGAVANGYEEGLAKEVFGWMESFANYGFNRSHSIAYGMIAMQMAYLKAHVPQLFYAAILNSVIGNHSKISEYLYEAKAVGIQIQEPDLRYSSTRFVSHNDKLYYPLSGIKGMRSTVIEAILEERSKGEFTGFFVTIARLHLCKVTKSFLTSLIEAGALDFCDENRASMLASLEEALRYAEIVKIEDDAQVYMDFSLVSMPHMIAVKENPRIRMELQQQALGVYLQDHPMVALRKHINPNLQPLLLQRNGADKIIGVAQIRKVRQHRTKKGDMMAFVSVEDETMRLDLVFMPKTYEKYKAHLQVDALLYFEAKNEPEQSCIVWSMKRIQLDGAAGEPA